MASQPASSSRTKCPIEVLAKFKHQVDRGLTSDELRDLVEFLNGR